LRFHEEDERARRSFTTTAAVAGALVPGLGLSGLVMMSGFAGADLLGETLLKVQDLPTDGPSPISGIPVAIVLGMAVKNGIGVPKICEPGVKFATKAILQAGIVCVGAKLSAVDLVTTGMVGIPCVLASVGVGLTVIPFVGRKLGLPNKMSALIAAGTSICGVTAITALSPAIKASERDTAFAVANVVAFGTFGMLIGPYILHHSILPDSQSTGIALGLSVHDTSQVLGAALSYFNLYGDEEVLKVATVTKLTRNLCLAAVIPGLTYMIAKQNKVDESQTKKLSLVPSFQEMKKYFPGFVAGFVGMAVLRTIGDVSVANYGVLNPEGWKWATSFIGKDVSGVLLGTAMAGVGLSTSTNALKGVGAKPFILGLAGATTVAGTGFASALAVSKFLT